MLVIANFLFSQESFAVVSADSLAAAPLLCYCHLLWCAYQCVRNANINIIIIIQPMYQHVDL